MLEVKFNVKNPYVVDMAGKMKDDALDKKYIRLAEEGGHDAVVFRNFRDSQSAGQRTGGLLEQVRGGSESTVVIPLSDDALPEVVNARTIDKRFSSKPKKTQAETIQRNIDESLRLAKEYKQRGLLDNDPELLAIAEAFENDAKKFHERKL